ncbi:MAG TPA: proton-conducting transporter membrane subunit, partial [Steroidobacteraceae bacterium]|nr:proton-conducting transporter membrane subunit [Steroidobacteraceae bacterium]
AVLESLVWVGLATVLAGTAGVLASRDLGAFTAYLTIVSVGLMLVGVGLFTPEGTSAALFYLVQSALLLAGLFLLREVVAGERAQAADCFTRGPRLARAAILPALFWLFAAAAVGLPPLTGFFGKLMLLRSAEDSVVQLVIWSVVLVSSLLLTLSAANAGSAMFWDRTPRSEPVDSSRAATPIAPVVIAAALQFVLVLGAEPLRAYTAATALELHAADGYRAAVLGSRAHSKADAALMGTEISP